MIEPDHDSPAWQFSMRASRQRVRALVRMTVEQNAEREAEAERQSKARHRAGWDKTNALFAPDPSLHETHKRLHLPLGRPHPLPPVEQVDPEPPSAASSIPDDYTPSAEPLPGTTTTEPEQ